MWRRCHHKLLHKESLDTFCRCDNTPTSPYRKSPELPYASLVIASQSCKLESCMIFFLGQCMGQFLFISIQVENWNGSFVYGSSSPISLLFSHHITGLPTKFMCKVYKVGLGLRLNQLVLDCVAYSYSQLDCEHTNKPSWKVTKTARAEQSENTRFWENNPNSSKFNADCWLFLRKCIHCGIMLVKLWLPFLSFLIWKKMKTKTKIFPN